MSEYIKIPFTLHNLRRIMDKKISGKVCVYNNEPVTDIKLDDDDYKTPKLPILAKITGDEFYPINVRYYGNGTLLADMVDGNDLTLMSNETERFGEGDILYCEAAYPFLFIHRGETNKGDSYYAINLAKCHIWQRGGCIAQDAQIKAIRFANESERIMLLNSLRDINEEWAVKYAKAFFGKNITYTPFNGDIVTYGTYYKAIGIFHEKIDEFTHKDYLTLYGGDIMSGSSTRWIDGYMRKATLEEMEMLERKIKESRYLATPQRYLTMIDRAKHKDGIVHGKVQTVPFNEDLAIDVINAKICGQIRTRDGHDVRIICFDRQADENIVVLVKDDDGHEYLRAYGKEGKMSMTDSNNDNDLVIDMYD